MIESLGGSSHENLLEKRVRLARKAGQQSGLSLTRRIISVVEIEFVRGINLNLPAAATSAYT
jgi:hypothetical protein